MYAYFSPQIGTEILVFVVVRDQSIYSRMKEKMMKKKNYLLFVINIYVTQNTSITKSMHLVLFFSIKCK